MSTPGVAGMPARRDRQGPSAVQPGAFQTLRPSQFAVAIALGLANGLFLALMHAPIASPSGRLVLEIIALVSTLLASIAAERAGQSRSAWILLASTYAVLVLAAIETPASARGVVIDQVMAHCIVLAVAVANRTVERGRSGRLAYVAAGVAGVVAGALAWGVIAQLGYDFFADDVWQDERTSPWFMVLHPASVALHWLLFGGAAVLLYGETRIARATIERLRAAELETIARSREVVESRLRALQARVEPQFLFNTLSQMRSLYDRDRRLAECVLDELVAFLRAAMPRMRDTSSTAAQEAALVRAYLGVMRFRTRDRLDVAIDVPAPAAAARLPPMLLLPLVDHALAHGLHGGRLGRTFTIASSIVGTQLHVDIVDTGGGFVVVAGDGALASIRERLTALYGSKASLALASVPGGTRALLDIPYEPAG